MIFVWAICIQDHIVSYMKWELDYVSKVVTFFVWFLVQKYLVWFSLHSKTNLGVSLVELHFEVLIWVVVSLAGFFNLPVCLCERISRVRSIRNTDVSSVYAGQDVGCKLLRWCRCTIVDSLMWNDCCSTKYLFCIAVVCCSGRLLKQLAGQKRTVPKVVDQNQTVSSKVVDGRVSVGTLSPVPTTIPYSAWCTR